jgi:hypothetical protein
VALVAAVACFGALETSMALASGRGSDAPGVDAYGNVGPAAAIPTGYWVDVDESGTTMSAALGGSGYLAATGTGNTNYGWAQECTQTSNGGPFSSGHYPPQTCAELGRPYSSEGSPELPSGFWFTGNEHCVSAGRRFSGSVFTWHVQLPQSGPWHVEAHIPSWTMYGQGNHYIVSSDEGRSESVLSQEAFHGQWVTLAGGTHNFTAGQDYTVELTQADTENGFCKYQMADQMKWVYDGSPTPPPGNTKTPVNTTPPIILGLAQQGQILTPIQGTWTNEPTSYTYQWERCDTSGANCSPISGATSQTYTLVEGDVGHTIVFDETALNAGGASAPVSSTATALVAAPQQLAQPPSSPPSSPQPQCPVAQTAAVGSSIGQRALAVATQTKDVKSPTGQGALAKALMARRIGGTASFTPARAVARTVAKRARRFSIAITLTKSLARFFEPGAECPQTLKGSGYVNFRQRAARWTVALPGVFHGSLNVIAIHNRTYVTAPQFTRGKTHKAIWVELRSTTDYRTFDKLPLLRDIVVLTNPLRSLDVLGSVKTSASRRAHRAAYFQSTEPWALTSDSPSINASCGQHAQSVANGDSIDAKHLTDRFSLNTKVDETTIQSWAESKITAEADSSGVCEETISVENAKADGFDVVFDFTSSSPTDPSVKAPQSTATAEWKVIYHVKQSPCLDGTWDTTFTEPNIFPGSTFTVTATALIGGNGIEWSRGFSTTWSEPWPTFSPLPPYEPIDEINTVTSIEKYDNTKGILVGQEALGFGNFSTEVVGPQLDSTVGTVSGATSELQTLARPMTLMLNCSAGTLLVEQDRTLTIGPPLSQTLHKTSPTPPPQITVEQNWRSEISAPVRSGS